MSMQEPALLKCLSDESFSSHLTISREQLTDLNPNIWNTVYLKGPVSNEIQKIEVEFDELSITFKDGWKEFVYQNTLQKHDILVFFLYEELNLFNVMVFDKLCRKIREKRGNCEGGKIGERKTVCAESSKVPHKKDRKPSYEKDILDVSSDNNSSNRNETRGKEPQSNNGKNIVEEWSKNETEDSESRKSDSSDSDSHMQLPEFTSDSSQDIKSNSKDESQTERRKVKVISTKRILRSRRRSVTDKEKERTKCRAGKFKSNNHTFMNAMKEHNVYNTFSLTVPTKKFARKHLPKKSTWVSVRLAGNGGRNDVRWPIKCNYTFSNGQSQWRFTSGWKNFSIQNYLEEGDVCVFEMIKKKFRQEKMEFVVRIFRVVEEVKSLVEVTVRSLLRNCN